MKYLIGIDGGGTHSRLLAVDASGNVLGVSHGKSTNVESNPLSVVRQNFVMLLRDFCDTFHQALDDCAALCFGTAGIDTEGTRRMIETMVVETGLACPTTVVNDAVIALYASTRGNPGLMLISGTGSIGYGINRARRTWRVGGFGYLVGDEASAYWVAREGISAALKAYDRSGPETCLVNDLCKALHLKEFDEIIDYVYQKNKSDLAKLSLVVADAQARGDAVAGGIFAETLEHLMRILRTLVRELDMGGEPYPLLLGGGFLPNNRWLRRALGERVAAEYPLLHIEALKTKAEWGAVHMAADLINVCIKKKEVDP